MSADREELLRLDEEARQLAHTSFEAPLVIEAGAGTGKTALLTARVIAWALGPGWRLHGTVGEPPQVARRVIERVVAITFTDAAAAEMAERVSEALADLVEGSTPPGLRPDLLGVAGEELRGRCLALADEMHRLPAMTIHSFCQRLLRAFPLEAGLHPAFEVDADESRLESVVEESVLAAVGSAAGEVLEDWETLAAEGVTMPQVAAAVKLLVTAGITATDLGRDPFGSRELERMAGTVRRALEAVLGAEDGRLEDDGTGVSAHTLEALRALAGLLGSDRRAPEAEELVAAAAAVDESALKRLEDWGREVFMATDARLLGGRTAWLAPAAARLSGLLRSVRGLCPHELAAARGVLGPLLGVVSGRLAAEGIVTYTELLRGARRLLASSRHLRSEIRRGIDQLLVDEFQDTDDVQCEIVAGLALEGEPGERPGLFIVGDPKQSVYAWRGADLAAYDSFKLRVMDEGGTVRPLIRNFRSVAPVLAEVERVVAPVMEERLGVQPPFQPLEPTADRATDPGFAVGEWTPVEYWLAWPANPGSGLANASARSGEATAEEGAMLAADIRRLHDEGGVRWRDVGVLLRTTTEQEAVLDRLRAAGVPFEVAREREYFRQREVVEAAALVRAVLDPSDQLALLTVLRSDAVGIPDVALGPLWDAGLPALLADLSTPGDEAMATIDRCIEQAAGGTPVDLPGADVLPDWPLALRAALETLLELRMSLRRDPPDVFTERLRSLWLAEVTASARYLGRFRRARLERFLAQLEVALITGDGSLAPVARFLRRAVEEARGPEVPVTPDTLSNAVHVMTVHSAKGLDFEHVYVVQMHRGDRGAPGGGGIDVVYGAEGLEYRVFGWATPGFAAAELGRRERERAERVRLLYVAMTRARRRLVLSGRWRDDGALVTAGDAACFADLVAHRLRPAELSPGAGGGRWRSVENPGHVQWVLPAGIARGVDAPPAAGEASAVAPERVRRDATLLAELRGAAAVRQAVPFAATVTGLVHREPEGEDGGDVPPARGGPAAAVGTAVHLLLATLDLGPDLAAQIEERREETVARVEAAVAPRDRESALRRLEAFLDRLTAGACLARLAEVAGSVVARELPLLLPPSDGDVLGFASGTADLVYLDEGAPVIADYKTDNVPDEAAVAERVEHYRPQLDWYARALQEAFELPATPRTELWFLDADRIVRL